MANGLKAIDQAIADVTAQLVLPDTKEEEAYHKALLNFLDGLRGQVKAFCATWTGEQTFERPKPKP